MLLCQISDPHIVKAGTLAYGKIDTPRMLERCARKIMALPRIPDAVVATGDLTEHASAEEYGLLQELLRPLTMPVYLAAGNHDDRQAIRKAFPNDPHLPKDGDFLQYTVEDHAVRLIVLDTLVPGEPYGALCEKRLQWLDDRLAESSRPTIIAQHHPPFETGMTIMDTMRLSQRDADAEANVVRKHGHVERIICGHYHRNIQARFAGTVASVCPSAAHQLVLDLVTGADIRFPFEPSAFHLHYWNGVLLVTHTQVVEDFPTWGSRD